MFASLPTPRGPVVFDPALFQGAVPTFPHGDTSHVSIAEMGTRIEVSCTTEEVLRVVTAALAKKTPVQAPSSLVATETDLPG